MKTWPIHEAEGRFSEVIERAVSEGPQVLSRSGKPEAVVLSMHEWQRLTRPASPDLRDLLLSDDARTDDLVLRERTWQMREPPVLD